MRFHILGLPHTWSAPEHHHCAYSMKVLKMVKGLSTRGHTVFHYGNEGSVVEAAEHVQIFSEVERAGFFGPFDHQKLYHLEWNAAEPYWALWNARAIEALLGRIEQGDFIVSFAGHCHKPIADAIPGSYSGVAQTAFWVEGGIGYYGVFSRYRVFESAAHLNWLAGAIGSKGLDTDAAVIPNYFDREEFVIDKPTEERLGPWIEAPYYLFMGRVIEDKGIGICLDTIEAIPDARLIVAGQGHLESKDPRVSFFGSANPKERAVLMGHATALLAPTLYREPFGGVVVESQMCGTPAITTDHGGFVENVPDEWRCNSHREFVHAALRARALDDSTRRSIRNRAILKYSIEAVMPLYEAYCGRLLDRFRAGWYEIRDGA
jgi:glycosyltransferase involved in cell wall biosynthesis